MIARAEVLVDAPPQEAFHLFTDEIGIWWRRGTYYWNDPERGLEIRLEPGVGGRFVEVYDADSGTGFEVGRVTAWEPGERLAFTWTQEDWPEESATVVEVTFAATGDGTRVTVTQSGFEGLPDAERSTSGYQAGWTEILGWLADHAASRRPA